MKLLIKRRPLKIALRVAAGFLVIYTATYLWLSLRGRYEPAAFGAHNRVKWYEWAPLGFADHSGWNNSRAMVFLPLYQIDRYFWHTCDRAHGRIYPINQISRKSVSPPKGRKLEARDPASPKK